LSDNSLDCLGIALEHVIEDDFFFPSFLSLLGWVSQGA